MLLEVQPFKPLVDYVSQQLVEITDGLGTIEWVSGSRVGFVTRRQNTIRQVHFTNTSILDSYLEVNRIRATKKVPTHHLRVHIYKQRSVSIIMSIL